MTDRRGFFGGALAGLLAQPAIAQSGGSPAVKVVFQHDLQSLALDKGEVTAVEVTYAPGVVSKAHRHPGFIAGYVLEGDYRFQVEGQPEVVLHAGQMFYEPAGAIHSVGSSASPTQPVRILALMIAEKGKPIATPA